MIATQTILDTLPTGTDPASAAVRSVYSRGFYDGGLPIMLHQSMMAQYLRLSEEVGEFETEVRHNGNSADIADELADVFIVLAQMAWLSGMDPGRMMREEPRRSRDNLHAYIGQMARWLRNYDGEWGPVQMELYNMAAHVHLLADQMGVSLSDKVMAKLDADERRGYRHGDG